MDHTTGKYRFCSQVKLAFKIAAEIINPTFLRPRSKIGLPDSDTKREPMWNWLVAVVVCPESKKLAADGFEAFSLASFMGRPLTPEALFEAEALEGSLVAEDSEGLLAVDVKAGLTLWDEDPILGLKGTLACAGWFVFSADFWV
jgi:hypothetical protein